MAETELTPTPGRIAQMVADPELGGELLLIGTVLSSIIDDQLADRPSIKRIHLLAYGPRGPELQNPGMPVVREPMPRRAGAVEWRECRTARLLAADARQYRMPEPDDYSCMAPTPRKPRCGKNNQISGRITDWTTGEQSVLAACRKHLDWFREHEATAQATKPEIGEVLPYANHGGVLARHFPEIDWPRLWSILNPQWREYPEREPAEPSTPKLNLLISDDAAPARPSRRGPATTKHRNHRLYAVPNLRGNSDD